MLLQANAFRDCKQTRHFVELFTGLFAAWYSHRTDSLDYPYKREQQLQQPMLLRHWFLPAQLQNSNSNDKQTNRFTRNEQQINGTHVVNSITKIRIYSGHLLSARKLKRRNETKYKWKALERNETRRSSLACLLTCPFCNTVSVSLQQPLIVSLTFTFALTFTVRVEPEQWPITTLKVLLKLHFPIQQNPWD